MEDRQAFVDGLVTLRANAGLGNWIVEPDPVAGFDVVELRDYGEKGWVAGVAEEDIADFIATTHAVIPELVTEFMAALDEADRLDEEKDDLIAKIFDLEVEADNQQATIDSLEGEVDDLERQLDDREDEISYLRDENASLNSEISELEDRISQLESDLWLANA